ncbi:class I SAM-dependent methyltransferase [Amycolatopsis sp. cg5]|uniref:class I SAM-dependent methyltransferase n=1 Tax=Amycolatopsis sp. cg5 TaxID=3238802 RepID=UPI0035231D5F
MYGDEFSEVYVSYYEGQGKDYAAEAEDITRLIREHTPGADSLLDVACGTGAHLRRFNQLFAHTEGVELSEGMVKAGRAHYPELTLHQGDMRDFHLGRKFDAVTCMFSSIGHVGGPDGLDATARCFAEHLVTGGTLVVEPWWFPENFIDGYVASGMSEVDGRRMVRLSHSVREGDATKITVHMAIADAERGLRHVTEVGLLSLFEQARYEKAFAQAGIDAEYVEGGPLGRGLFVGTRR